MVILSRVHLNRQIQLLVEHMASSTQDEARQRSHSMASTTATYGHHPSMSPQSILVMDNDRFQSQVYTRNGPGDRNLFYSSAPMSYTDNLSTPQNSVSRDYAPKVIDVNYTEGCNDKRWSSTNFPWTKDLEVILFLSKPSVYYLLQHLFMKITNFECLFRPRTKASLETVHSVQISEK
jgi:bloom syndrome protein